MTTQGGRQRTNVPKYLGADEALNQISKEAEDRLTASNAARAEAREIRHREIEKKKKEQEKMEGEEETGDSTAATDTGKSEPLATAMNSLTTSSLPSQGDTIDGTFPLLDKNKDYRSECKELQEKYRGAMMNIAQLDNEKMALVFAVDRLSEEREEREESHLELQRQLKEKTHAFEFVKRDLNDRGIELAQLKEIIEQQNTLMQNSGLMAVHDEEGKVVLEPTSKMCGPVTGSVLLSAETVSLMDGVEGSLDTKVRKLAQEKLRQDEEIRKLQQQLEEFQQRVGDDLGAGQVTANGTDRESYEVQQAYTTIHEQKLLLQKSEQRIVFLEGTVARYEEQLKKFKKDAEEAEEALDGLRTEKRKLQRELRESKSKEEDLKSQNEHLTKRLEKIKQTRQALAASDSTLFADNEWLKATEDAKPSS